MREKIDVKIGQQFFWWTILKELKPKQFDCGQRQRIFLCQCKCGKQKKVVLGHLQNGTSKSCKSCAFGKDFGKFTRKHGESFTRFYRIWAGMKGRCLTKSNGSFKNYGAKGIKICEKWKKFANFKKDMYKSYKEHKTKTYICMFSYAYKIC